MKDCWRKRERKIMELSQRINGAITGLALAALVGGGWVIHAYIPGGKAALYVLGGLMGITLFHAAFGFTYGWRRLVTEGRADHMRAQFVAFALAAALIMPVLASGQIFGHGVIGATAPVGVAMLTGAFIFGFGMQLGGGCASGTLYTAGSGSSRMVLVLIFFVAGSVLGSAHLPWWFNTPRLKHGTLLDMYGLSGALLATFAALAILAIITWIIERRAGPKPETKPTDLATTAIPWYRRVFTGPWPLLVGAVVLALGNFAVIAISGHTWSISFGFALWGAKALAAIGIDISQTEFWTWPYPARALKGSLFAEDTSAMNFGILVGAALAASLAGKFARPKTFALRPALAAIIGGLLMGYGARLASGCNIGALFSGIASGSLHGWAWLVAGFTGSYLGIKARPLFNL